MAALCPSIRLLRLAIPRGLSVVQQKQYSSKESLSLLEALWDRDAGVSPHKDAHSKTLASSAVTYEFQFEDVKPECMETYLKETAIMNTKLHEDTSYPGTLFGSWTAIYGDQDKAVHLWVYEDGYKGVTQQMKYNIENQEIREFNTLKSTWLRSRSNQLCQHFSYWGEARQRKKPHVYELRTYALQPGTLIEWKNKWSSAIKIRRKDAVGGFFSQVGDLYMVHHLWAYYDMEHRKEERENMWQTPGWDDCVAATVPLIRHMKSRILIPTSNSPMQ